MTTPTSSFVPGDEGAALLSGKVAIVSGGGSQIDEGIGNGKATAILLAREGARVLVVDRRLAAAEATVAAITADGGEAVAHEADVTDEAACEAMVQVALDRWGGVSVLVNNVGIGSSGTVVDETVDQWDRVMAVNVRSMMLTSKFSIPAIAAAEGPDDRGGAIVNISSVSTLRPRGLTAYSTSKGAVIALTKAMAVDHAAQGIRVNCVAPGPIYTPMVYKGGMSDAARAQRANASLLQIEGSPWDVGNAVVFLASHRARYLTGQTLVVDGGVTLRGPSRDPGNEGQ
ncbi:MAG: SDR family NAD(P)-dependent oxidoreductase [Actinomycetota bacterium]|nr:SDR family NAD(P)-dependent oxidoreductase [Actinomycetota bacterium]